MFDWNDSFSVKIPEVDEQHQRLFEIGENINKLVTEYDGDVYFQEVTDELDNLFTYTKYHFAQEEQLMEMFDYPDLDNHIAEHNKFIHYLEDIEISDDNENKKEVLTKLLQFIATWIFKHINNTDFQYSHFILEKMGKSK